MFLGVGNAVAFVPVELQFHPYCAVRSFISLCLCSLVWTIMELEFVFLGVGNAVAFVPVELYLFLHNFLFRLDVDA